MSKGKRNERETADVYERAGYHTYRPQESKYGPTDIYGLFDILAVPPAGSNNQARLIQVKTNRASGIQSWAGSALQYASKSVHVEFVVRYDGHGGPHPTPPCYRLIMPQQDPTTRTTTVLDERNDDVPGDGEGLWQYLEATL